jgi:hypothetical protein
MFSMDGDRALVFVVEVGVTISRLKILSDVLRCNPAVGLVQTHGDVTENHKPCILLVILALDIWSVDLAGAGEIGISLVL